MAMSQGSSRTVREDVTDKELLALTDNKPKASTTVLQHAPDIIGGHLVDLRDN